MRACQSEDGTTVVGFDQVIVQERFVVMEVAMGMALVYSSPWFVWKYERAYYRISVYDLSQL